jgi:hypothetical protein
MQYPHLFYAAAVVLACVIEAVGYLRRRDAVGPVVWVIAAVTGLAYVGLWAGANLPMTQMALHCGGLIVAMTVARGIIGLLTAGLYFPMAMAGAMHTLGLISPATWWWALFYIACAQLAILGAGANFHPLGRAIRRWSSEAHQRFERLAWGNA